MKRLLLITSIACLLTAASACSAIRGDCPCNKKKEAPTCDKTANAAPKDGGDTCGN